MHEFLRVCHRLRLLLTAAFCATTLSVSGALAGTVELVMFESPGCPYCARWRAEVGPAYARSDEGRKAPLRNVELSREPGFRLQSPVVVSPTFVLVENGREIGRIVGYPGADFFWGMLDSLMQRVGRTSGVEPGVQRVLALVVQ